MSTPKNYARIAAVEPLPPIKPWDRRIKRQKPRPHRTPRGRRVTVAVGIKSFTGAIGNFVVLAADSQESYGGADLKRRVDKIHMRFDSMPTSGDEPPKGASIAITGSGGSNYLSYLNSEIETLYWRHIASDSLETFGAAVESYLISF